jgi:hypothetical protein
MRVAVAVATCLFAILLPAAPAAAHPAGIQAAVDYRTSVTAVTPSVDGVRVRFVADGSRLELLGDAGHTVEILGYDGEPMLRVGPDGAWRNTRSPSLYVDVPGGAARAGASSRAEPDWQRDSDRALVRWQDHRTLWHGNPPPQVAAAPDRGQRVTDWRVPLRVDGQQVAVVGVIDWVPRPDAGSWWLAMLVLAGVVTGFGAAAAPRRRAVARAILVGTGFTVGAAVLAYQILLVAANAEPGGYALALLGRALPLVLGVALIAGAAAVLAGRDVGLFLLAVGGPLTAFLVGLQNVALLHHGVAPIAIDAVWARVVEVVVLGGGAGLLGFALVRARQSVIRRASSQAAGEPVTP